MDNQNPFFSIIMPTYNRAEFLQEAINSVLGQSFQNWELIIVDDASQDKSKEYLEKEIKDERIKVFLNSENIGASASRIRAIQESYGTYLMFLDSDNEFLTDLLEEYQSLISEKSDVDVLWCGVIYKYFEKKELKKEKKYFWNPKNLSSDKYFFLKSLRVGTGLGLCIKKSKYLECGGFDSRLKAAEDTDLLIRLLPISRIQVLNKFLFISKKHEHERLSNNFKNQAEAYDIIHLKYSKIFKKYWWKSGRFFRKAAYYHLKAGNKKTHYLIFIKAIINNPFNIKNYLSILRW